jgi:hypothetical protein
MNEVLFINWLQNVLFWWNQNLRLRFQYEAPIVLLLHGHATYANAWGLAFAGSERILILRLTVYSSHLAQLCIFGVFKILSKNESKIKGMKGETVKIYQAMTTFYEATIMPMVRWSFIRAWFGRNPNDHLAHLPVNPGTVLSRTAIPEIILEELVARETMRVPRSTERPVRRRHQIPSPHELVMSLQAYVSKVNRTRPLCEHSEEEDSSEEEAMTA